MLKARDHVLCGSSVAVTARLRIAVRMGKALDIGPLKEKTRSVTCERIHPRGAAELRIVVYGFAYERAGAQTQSYIGL
ncbi:hypothetical protein [Mycetohabitans sp. B46]|uniref:hypothetical protein n=1 Tax=Mycetohabitans sp. B46 TaxID=2772536 RepID=UPI00307DDEB2